MPCQRSLCFLVSPFTYRTPCHARGHLVIYCKCYRFERAFFTQAFFTLQSFLLILSLPYSWQFNLKVSRASCQSSKHNPCSTIAWITAIHKRDISVGSVYVPKASFKVRVPQPWNLPLNGFEPAFLKVTCVSCLSWQLGHRFLWVLIDG